MNRFSERLKEQRLLRCYYQREMAEIAGIKLRAYQLYESGNTEPKIDVLIKFADLFGVSVDYLIGHDKITSPGDIVEEF